MILRFIYGKVIGTYVWKQSDDRHRNLISLEMAVMFEKYVVDICEAPDIKIKTVLLKREIEWQAVLTSIHSVLVWRSTIIIQHMCLRICE